MFSIPVVVTEKERTWEIDRNRSYEMFEAVVESDNKSYEPPIKRSSKVDKQLPAKVHDADYESTRTEYEDLTLDATKLHNDQRG